MNKKKRYKIILIVAGSIISILCAGIFFIGLRWKPILRNTIENTVINVSDSLYNINFSDIDVNLFTGSVSLSNVELSKDSLIYEKMIKQRIAPENTFNLKIKQLHISNLKPFQVYFKRYLDIQDITISEPELLITYTRLKNKIKKPVDRRTTYEKIKNTLKSASLNKLTLKEVAFTYIDKSLKKPDITKVNRLNIHVNDILIDSITQYDTTRIFHAKNIAAELNDFHYPTADSLYHVKIGRLNFSTAQKNLMVKDFELLPRYGEIAFSDLFERQQDRYKIHFDSINLDNVNYLTLIDDRTVSTQKLSLNGGKLSISLNRAKPKKLIDKGQNYPHLALKRVNWNVNADTVDITKTDIHYTEYSADEFGKGTVSFYNLNGRIFNATNARTLLAKNKFIDAHMQTSFMGKGKLNVHIKFDMLDQNGAFQYKGSLDGMPLQALNPVSKPLAKIMFNSGQINRLDFSVKANLKGGGGTVTVTYDKLNVVLLKKDDDKNTFKKMGLISLLANALIIKEDNPSKGEEVRVTSPYYARPSDASFFNLMWKVIFLGFKETIGITQKAETDFKEQSDKFKEMQKAKEERKLRRQKRKEKK